MVPFQDAQYSSSQSSSNTLSSNASSSSHSDEKWYEVGSRSGVRTDLELSGYLQGASTDSGIDTTSFTATQSSTASSTAAFMPKDKVPWQEETAEDQGPVDTPPPTPDSLLIRAGEIPPRSPSALPLGPDGGLGEAASRSRYAAAPQHSVLLHEYLIKQTMVLYSALTQKSKALWFGTKGKED